MNIFYFYLLVMFIPTICLYFDPDISFWDIKDRLLVSLGIPFIMATILFGIVCIIDFIKGL